METISVYLYKEYDVVWKIKVRSKWTTKAIQLLLKKQSLPTQKKKHVFEYIAFT